MNFKPDPKGTTLWTDSHTASFGDHNVRLGGSIGACRIGLWLREIVRVLAHSSSRDLTGL